MRGNWSGKRARRARICRGIAPDLVPESGAREGIVLPFAGEIEYSDAAQINVGTSTDSKIRASSGAASRSPFLASA